VFGATGVGGPGAYLAATVVLLLFAVGYATMSRCVTSAGGFAAYISRGLGRPWGFAAAFVALLAYNAMLAGIFGQLGAFAHDILLDQLGIDLPWQAWVAIGLAIVAILGYRDVQISARVLGVLLICEVLILLLLDVVIIGDGGDSGLTGTGFEPAKVFGGAAGVAITFAFSCFVGFEATTIYGEEARDPKRTVPRATYVAILAIGLFYTLTMWAIGAGYGSGEVAKAAQSNPVAFVLDLNTRYVGSTATDIMNLLVITSLFAVVLAFHNTLARYLYSRARRRAAGAARPHTRRRRRSVRRQRRAVVHHHARRGAVRGVRRRPVPEPVRVARRARDARRSRPAGSGLGGGDRVLPAHRCRHARLANARRAAARPVRPFDCDLPRPAQLRRAHRRHVRRRAAAAVACGAGGPRRLRALGGDARPRHRPRRRARARAGRGGDARTCGGRHLNETRPSEPPSAAQAMSRTRKGRSCRVPSPMELIKAVAAVCAGPPGD